MMTFMKWDKRTKNEKPRYEVRDKNTGEVIPAVTWVRKKWGGANFFMGFQEAFAEIAQKRLGSEANDVFLLILGRVDYNNQVAIPQVEIARQLGMKKQNVSRAIARLVKERVLLVDALHSKYKRQLKLNDQYVWKGKLKHLGERQRSFKKKTSGDPNG
jgi:hypothetical protein